MHLYRQIFQASTNQAISYKLEHLVKNGAITIQICVWNGALTIQMCVCIRMLFLCTVHICIFLRVTTLYYRLEIEKLIYTFSLVKSSS